MVGVMLSPDSCGQSLATLNIANVCMDRHDNYLLFVFMITYQILRELMRMRTTSLSAKITR